jgi:hypothetical protein
MTWEYRVMCYKGGLAIYEVYYNEDGEVNGYSEIPVSPRGETLDELSEDFIRYAEALTKAVLEYKV